MTLCPCRSSCKSSAPFRTACDPDEMGAETISLPLPCVLANGPDTPYGAGVARHLLRCFVSTSSAVPEYGVRLGEWRITPLGNRVRLHRPWASS